MKSIIFLFCLVLLGSNNALAFSCTYANNNSHSISLGDVKDIGNEIVLYNFLAQTCSGNLHIDYQDALRISAVVKSTALIGSGLEILFKSEAGSYYSWDDGLKGRCIWPVEGTYCQGSNYNNVNHYTYSMKGKVVLRRVSGTESGVTIPAGTELASLQFQQRGYYPSSPATWGGNYYTIAFRNTDSLDFPTCNIDSANLDKSVILPSVDKNAFSNVGSTAGSTQFQYDLDCESGVAVNVTLEDGNNLSNTSDTFVLQNDSTASGVGIQMLHNGALIRFKERNVLIPSAAQGSNVIAFSARYIKNAVNVEPGSVKANAIISFDYL
ncbi:fimbrial protein [Vibrio sp. RC586]|uniref:fimbrial protein n=1 Tax=Vibrio sp. RC586 TaxID=675815 RepID=UPI0001BB805A|nr:fimbrial protein [Vibrio sp. RC586]EEY99518.1 fimbrial protein [Vibrio sp. RC586]